MYADQIERGVEKRHCRVSLGNKERSLGCVLRLIMRKLALIFILAILSPATPGLPQNGIQPTAVDHIVVLKSGHIMRLYSHDKLVKEYHVALGLNPVGPKRRKGDNRTPEGSYVIDLKNPHSQFHLSLRVSYPNAQDRERARRLGVDPGGSIMIHGLPREFASLGARHRENDWTWGCIAVTNPEIEEIWSLVQVGTKIEIRP
jgi:murein L,D-transpeptidase YafK